MRNNLVKEREHKACGEQIALTIGLAVLIAVCVVALLFLRKQPAIPSENASEPFADD